MYMYICLIFEHTENPLYHKHHYLPGDDIMDILKELEVPTTVYVIQSLNLESFSQVPRQEIQRPL